MCHGGLSLCFLGILLSGCAADSGGAAEVGTPIGYRYHDSNHPNDSSQASPQAIYNAMHGTWLWAPANNVVND
jgi:hypothetical protein